MESPIDVTVRDKGAYLTNTVRGQRSSCTHSAEEAARRLGVKLFGLSLDRVEYLGDGESHSITKWRLYAIKKP